MSSMPRFHIITFGCQMNVNDSAWLARSLRARGFEEAERVQDAGIVVINTCSVRDKPEQKVYSQLGRLRSLFDKNAEAFAVVGGCVAQQLGDSLSKRFPFVRLVFGADGAAMAPQAIERLVHEPALSLSLVDFSEEYTERDTLAEKSSDTDVSGTGGQAFVSIMQGCDNFCAYCIVPYVRGRQKSRSAASVIRECQSWVERGVREITLLGQNVNSYGQDEAGRGEPSFAQLLRRVAAIDGLERLRFTTSHPKDIAPEVVEAFGELEALCPSLHLPLQSGSDRVLAAMGRRYDRARYMDVVRRLREVREGMQITTDLMVGFPGETEEDFMQTLEAMEEAGFAQSFSFMYSDRPGVRAARMLDKIPEEVKSQRLAALQELQHGLTTRTLESLVGSETLLLVEGVSKKQPASRRNAQPTAACATEEPGAQDVAQTRAGNAVPEFDGVTSACVRGRDPYGNVVNMRLPEGRDPETIASGSLAKARILMAKKHSLLGELVGEPW
ncbi:tRNA (N6-isopentenyl adenosine(37)-C2)-methylthiotransferase MiaB [Oceanidesulfovibrio indonesiensis]|uniref:tRNA-2-methylthio-N(6)-dimethylallyladenosine synthase n=1 Tax=Oceanidesulfovibrio indonesiensis TaxID=54767 RepID=A0A7M3MH33_9BACT|nr:tRNA (N6-isopentenyl adenosine(37)-C2)-methylthiotransferase MiaB [Oceanidesulfovibrio indonesiensis]TVM18796.1 tRNA (N6-isopentenyl adenosine(37)-C2)-methylthiotransferase MiaB [Oceanidesulfovibrio indonesiensis]